jgi:methionyl aminopeptidase
MGMSKKRRARRAWRRQEDRIHYKSPKEIRLMKDAGMLVHEAFQMLKTHVAPGVSLETLDKLTEDFILSRGAKPLYQGYNGGRTDQPPFPGVICAAINEVICHGIPDGQVLKEGDIIGIDIGVLLNGYCGDACVTFPVGKISEQAQRLLDVTKECLNRGIEACQPRGFLGDIGHAIHDYADSQGVSVVIEWGGHGIGKNLHEPPSVGHIRPRGSDPGMRLKPGLVFTIEPMINAGTHEWDLMPDQWTVKTRDRQLSAQFEHTIAITKKGHAILTAP